MEETTKGKGAFANAEALNKFLLEHGVSTLYYGTGKAKTIEKLWGELEGAEAQLCLTTPVVVLRNT